MPAHAPTSHFRSDTPHQRVRNRLVAGVMVGLLAGVTACGAGTGPGEEAGSGDQAGSPAPSSATATGLVESALQVDPALADAPLDTSRQVLAPTGWTVSVWARVDAARLLAWAPDGRLLVSRPKLGDVVALAPGSGAAPTQTTLLSGLNQPHGLAFAGSTLYVAQSDQVDAYAYADGTATGSRVVVDGLPDAKSPELKGAYAHALKSVTVGPDGAVYVSVGSTGNLSVEDRDADPERATILRVPKDRFGAAASSAEVFARGVRNGTGLAVDPDGAVWTAVNNRDQTAYPYDADYNGNGTSDQNKVLQSYVNDHPLEPLAKLTQGRDLGWPFCNPDPDLSPGKPDSAFSYTDRPFVADQQTNADGSKLDCAALPAVEQGLGAHSAPLGLSFTTGSGLPQPYGGGALVGVHGSWNRNPPRAPEVSFFPWRDGTLGPQQTLLGGFQDEEGTRWGKPVMAVQGPDGAVYVSDDLAGAIYRLAPPA